jgi:hypothetical protein
MRAPQLVGGNALRGARRVVDGLAGDAAHAAQVGVALA